MFCGLSKSSFLMAALLVCGASPALDAAGVVTNCNSSGPGSLTATISGGGLVTFAISCPSTSPIAITATLSIVANTTIDATGYNVALDGGTHALFSVSATLALNDLTLQNGFSNSPGGGAINNVGSVIVTNSTFSSNKGALGGAIYNNGTAVIANSTFYNNGLGTTLQGGAINNDVAGKLTVTNSTFVQNTTLGGGGAIFQGGGVASIANSTFLGNGAGTSGGTILVAGDTTLENDILAGVNTGGECYVVVGLTDGGYNLSDDASCGFTTTASENSVSSANLNLGMLGSYGGPTQTVPVNSPSDAIGKIPAGTNGCATGIVADQRGVVRPGSLNANCSIGAYEYVPAANFTITDCTSDTQLQSAVTSGGRIVFGCSGSIVLSQTLNVTSNTALDATGQIVALDGGGSMPILTNMSSSLTINNLTLQNGSNAFGTVGNEALMAVTNSTFSNNYALEGGAIFNQGFLTVANSTFESNSAGDRGGAILNYQGSATITNVTFYNNSTNSNLSFSGGGAVFAMLGVVIIRSSSFLSNSATNGGLVTTYGGGISNLHAAVTLENTIVAGSGASGGDCAGTITDGGFNLDDDGSCGLSSANHSFSNNASANLGTLSYNGGPARTIPLNAGSTALGAIPLGASGCGAVDPNFGSLILTDERGVFRPQNSNTGLACDIGALQTAQNQVEMTFNTSPSSGPAYIFGSRTFAGQQMFTLPVDTLSTVWAPSPENFSGTTIYTLVSWSDGGAAAHQITISPATPSELAKFNVSYLVATFVSPAGGGTVSVSANQTGSGDYYPSGTQITLTAHPAANYLFSGWTGTIASTSNPLTFTLNGPVLATANFLRVTTTVGSVSQAPVAWGQPVTLFASVSNGTATPPTGTVTFKLGSTTIGSGPLINGAATYNSNGQQLAPGGNHLIAVYSGDSGDAPSTSTNYFEVLVEQATTTTSVSYSPNPAVPYETITFTATVNPQYSGTPTGTVTFYQNGVAQATVALVNGNATYSVRTLNAGTYTIKATYNGSTNFSGSSGTVKATVL